MTESDLRIELTKMSNQQQQWHDEFEQREHHWFWQRGFWLFMAGATLMSVLISVATLIVI